MDWKELDDRLQEITPEGECWCIYHSGPYCLIVECFDGFWVEDDYEVFCVYQRENCVPQIIGPDSDRFDAIDILANKVFFENRRGR